MSQNNIDIADVDRAAPKGRPRNLGIDFVRGSLIVLMILYHSAVFSQDDPYVILLRDNFFTVSSGGFVFMAGVTIRKFAFSSFCANRYKSSRHLVLRGIRLILFFCSAVLAGHVFQMLPPPDGAVQDYLVRVFLLSYPEGVPYDVLLGIGYLFCISPLILYLLQRKALSLVVSLLAFSAVTAVGYRVGQNAWIVLCGLWGMALAHVSMEMFGVKQRSMMLQLPWQYSFGVFLIAALAYGALGAPKSNVIVYVSYLVFVMTMIYHIFSRILCNQVDSAIVKIVCKAGSMSLFCYVVHVPACIILEKYIEWSGGVASFIIGSSLILSLTTILMLLVDAAGHCAAIHVAPADFSAATPGTRPRLLREPVKFR